MKKKDNDNEVEYELLLFNSEGEDDVEVDYLSKITDTVTWSTDWTIESIISAHKRSSFNINPSFQRRDAWTDTKKSRFIESLIFGLPVPQIVLAEDKNQRGKYLVVDGKQRLITLFTFFSEDTNDRFKLTGLKSSKINGLDFVQLEQQHPDLYNNLLNQSIRSIIIKNWTTENLLYTIFFRLNSGSLPLSPQELRKALKPGEFLKKIDFYCLESVAIKFLFGDDVPDARMRDMDLLLRFFVMNRFIDEYKGNYKSAVDQVCDFYNKSWNRSETEVNKYLENFEHTIAKARLIFGDDEVFRRKSNSKVERRINRALFDIVVYYLSQVDDNVAAACSKKIKDLTDDLSQRNPQFMKALSSNTNNLKETSTRFVIYGEGLQGLSINVRIPQNLKDYYSKL
jgi:hypothetical protein